jgi:hypothetical protein
MYSYQHQPLKIQAEKLYNQFGKPLEETHKGKYIAISPNGNTLIGDVLIDLMEQAKVTLGPGNYIFKIGERSVGKWL